MSAWLGSHSLMHTATSLTSLSILRQVSNQLLQDRWLVCVHSLPCGFFQHHTCCNLPCEAALDAPPCMSHYLA